MSVAAGLELEHDPFTTAAEESVKELLAAGKAHCRGETPNIPQHVKGKSLY